MRVTAKQIHEWASSLEARSYLPRLVRRLSLDVTKVTQIAFPAGESTSLPGWDGELYSKEDNPWVPKGKSFWELSCEANPTAKANKDYSKRTKNTPANVRCESTLIIVTARCWGKKKTEWVKARNDSGDWLAVRAYDADDL